MKKFLKYAGIGLGSLVLVGIISFIILNYQYRYWSDFIDAAKANDIVKMQELVDEGFDINQKLIGVLPLQSAIIDNSNYATIKFMLDHGANPNLKTKNNLLPIHYAILGQRPDIVKLLLDYGTDSSYVIKGKNILDVAYKSKNPEIIEIIKQYQQQ